jgi:hypothetical protein
VHLLQRLYSFASLPQVCKNYTYLTK